MIAQSPNIDDGQCFGLVKESPAFLIWALRRLDGWVCVCGASSRRAAEGLAPLYVEGRRWLVLPRGRRPETVVSEERYQAERQDLYRRRA